MGIGLMRAGLPGMLAAWLGFTLPSALLMIAAAYGAVALGGSEAGGILHGLKVVAQAVMQMARTLAPDAPRASMAALAAAAALVWPAAPGQIGVLLAGGLAGLAVLRPGPMDGHVPFRSPVGPRMGAAAIMTFFALLALLPLLARTGGAGVQLFDIPAGRSGQDRPRPHAATLHERRRPPCRREVKRLSFRPRRRRRSENPLCRMPLPPELPEREACQMRVPRPLRRRLSPSCPLAPQADAAPFRACGPAICAKRRFQAPRACAPPRQRRPRSCPPAAA